MRTTTRDLQDMRRAREGIAALTAYDYTSAKLLEQAGIRLLLVGDSLGQVVLGYDTTVPVTMDEMVHHVKAVVRGTREAHVVADMPFMSYQITPEEAVRNAGRLLKEGGCQSVKLEGGRSIAPTVARIVESGVPVMGHIGLTPQSVNQLGGYRVQGKTPESASRLIDDALALEQAGVYAIVLELVPALLAGLITKRVMVPTIGIGAGQGCGGQIQVLHDILGMFEDFVPKHTRRYADLGSSIRAAVAAYAQDVVSGGFPAAEESFGMDAGVVESLAASGSE